MIFDPKLLNLEEWHQESTKIDLKLSLPNSLKNCTSRNPSKTDEIRIQLDKAHGVVMHY